MSEFEQFSLNIEDEQVNPFPVEDNKGRAITAMVLGICSCAVNVLFGSVPILGTLLGRMGILGTVVSTVIFALIGVGLGLAALLMGNSCRMSTNGATRTFARVARITGIIGMAVSVINAVATIVSAGTFTIGEYLV